MRCPKCRSLSADGTPFCAQCGMTLAIQPVSTPSMAPTKPTPEPMRVRDVPSLVRGWPSQPSLPRRARYSYPWWFWTAIALVGLVVIATLARDHRTTTNRDMSFSDFLEARRAAGAIGLGHPQEKAAAFATVGTTAREAARHLDGVVHEGVLGVAFSAEDLSRCLGQSRTTYEGCESEKTDYDTSIAVLHRELQRAAVP